MHDLRLALGGRVAISPPGTLDGARRVAPAPEELPQPGEHGEGEESEEPIPSILRAFGRLGWHGIDHDGEFALE